MQAWGFPSSRTLITGVLCTLAVSAVVPAQTFNALRDPRRSVFEAFPEANGYREIVRDVDQDARAAIEARLPFRIHFHELGAHTLYVALRGQAPIGMIYVRSEESRWGLIEIAWHLGVDLRTIGFRFHRCRSTRRDELARSAFARRLAGCDFAELAALVGPDGRLVAGAATVPRGTEELSATVVRSALKALAVIDSVWTEEITKLRDLQMGCEAFPQGASYRRFVSRLVRPDEDAPLQHGQPTGSIRAVRVTRDDGSLLGTVLRSETRWNDDILVARWILRHDDCIEAIIADVPWADRELRASCRELEGLSLEAAAAVDSELATTARELSVALRRMARKGRR